MKKRAGNSIMHEHMICIFVWIGELDSYQVDGKKIDWNYT